MKFDKKIRVAIFLEIIIGTIVLLLIFVFPDQKISNYRLWEILPAILATMVTTLGLKEMRKRT